MKEHTYHEQTNINNALKLRELIATLPRFCSEFFRGIEPTTSSRTRIAYAYDLRTFFEFLHDTNSECAKVEIENLKLDILDQIKAVDIEEYLDYLKYYIKAGSEHTNDERAKMRKLAALRTFYNYFFKKEMITTNPAVLVTMPKIHEKNIIRLDIDEVAMLLDEVEQGDKLTAKQKQFHAKTKLRDLAMMTLLLGTGIRVSECVGLDIDDLEDRKSVV